MFMEDSNWSLITMVIHKKRFFATFALSAYLLAPFFASRVAKSGTFFGTEASFWLKSSAVLTLFCGGF